MNALQRFQVGIVLALVFYCSNCRVRADEPADARQNGAPTDEAARNEAGAKAKALYAQAEELFREGHNENATKRLEEMLAVLGQLYPKERFPHGSSDIAFTLRNLGVVAKSANQFDRAELWLEKALSMYRELYPQEQFPAGRPEIAEVLIHLGLASQAKGELEVATGHFEEALAMFRRIFPASSFPDGHRQIATALSILAGVLQLQHNNVEALSRKEEAAQMLEKLYPEDTAPSEQETIAAELTVAGIWASLLGDRPRARQHLRKAINLLERLYPAATYPLGSKQLATTELAMAGTLRRDGDPAAALPYAERGVAIRKRLVEAKNGDLELRDLSGALTTMALVLQDLRDYDRGEQAAKEALTVRESLYAREKSPSDRADIAGSLSILAVLLGANGDQGGSATYTHRALAIYDELRANGSLRDADHLAAMLLERLAMVQLNLSHFALAKAHQKQAFERFKRLYARDRFPDGHPDLAMSLNNMAPILEAEGDFDGAREHYERALEMFRRVHTTASFPQGHPSIATTLDNLANLHFRQGTHDLAKSYQDMALALRERLYSRDRFPDGHPDLAISLNNMAPILEAQGDFAGAREHYERALAMLRHIYATRDYPSGHPLLATTLNNLGNLHFRQGKYDLARAYEERALSLRETLYGPDRFPNGHQDLVVSLNNIAIVLTAQGDFERASDHYERAVAMLRRVYVTAAYPSGHPLLATTLNNVANVHVALGKYDLAERCAEEAVTIAERFYGQKSFPEGHHDLALYLDTMANASMAQGKVHDAEALFQKAIEMRRRLFRSGNDDVGRRGVALSLNNLAEAKRRCGNHVGAQELFDEGGEMLDKLYPADLYPNGHPELAASLANRGGIRLLQHKYEESAAPVLRAYNMIMTLAATSSESLAVGEALNLLALSQPTRSGLLSLWHRTNRGRGELYDAVWCERGLISRAAGNRLDSLHDAGDPDASRRLLAYAAIEHELARLSLLPVASDARQSDTRRARLREVVDEKERLERDLASNVPEFARKRASLCSPHTLLREQLSAHEALVEFVHYIDVDQDPQAPGNGGARLTPSYMAFVIARDCATDMVRIAPAQPVEAMVREWREAIANERASDAPATLRRLVWEPIEKMLPAGTDTIYIVPDGPLTALPWAALAGKLPGSALLDEYSLALVPYGPFLLDRLTAQRRTQRGDDVLLAVGDVAYDDQPTAPPDAGQLAALRGEAGLEGPHVHWPALPGTREELDGLSALAGDRQGIILSASDASTTRVLAELPKARWAIFATHGFFADPKLRSALQLDENIFEHRAFLMGGGRTTPVGRNPLLLSGLVLASANLPRPEDEFGIPQGDGGILSAEVIASLPLDKLELAVLSACDTGLGEVAGGEGVFGLQRAFHQAGAANVVASLWKIDDLATAALMRLFYYKLFREKKPPLRALREAQLAIYHHPEQIGPLAAARAPEFGNAVKLVDGGKSTKPNGHAATRLWAGFVLSGAGR
jgi:tetratricopeptide (TPR) repeat protein/CHAT domain-containing protein